MNQVYNNPLIIRNVEFKEYLTEEEALKKINEFRFSDAGQALPDSKKNSLRRIANYFVTHPNFSEVSDDHVLIREGYPVIFTSKNYRKIKYEKPVKKEGIDESSNRNNETLDIDIDGDGDGEIRKSNISRPKIKIRDVLKAKGIDYGPKTLAPDEDGNLKLVNVEKFKNKTAQESSARKDNAKLNKMPKNQSIIVNNESNRVVISSKKKKKKKSMNEESNNTTIKDDVQEIGLVQEINVERPSNQSGFNVGEKSGVKKNEATKESGSVKDNSSVKKVRKEKKSENEVVARISKKRTSRESELINNDINVKKVKVDSSKNSMVDEGSNDISSKAIDERRLIHDAPKIIDGTAGLTQGTASNFLKKKKKKKSKEESTNLEAIQGISKVKNDKKDSSKAKEEEISTNTGNAVTINMKKVKKKKKLQVTKDRT